MMFRWTTVAALGIAFVVSLTGNAADSEALPVKIKPDNAKIRYVGRFTKDANPKCAWPGSTITVKFTGTAINALLSDSAKATKHKVGGLNTDYVNAVIDGGKPMVFPLVKDQTVYRVGDNLAPGEHTLELTKRTESFVGIIEFKGLELSAGGKLLDLPAPERRIEFIGDSITCGYGNEAPNEKTHFSPSTENNYLAYGALTARHFKADYICIAWSGIGVYSSRGDTKNTMLKRYDAILPWGGKKWDFKQWIPQVVVVNLGTNDFAKGDPGDNYVDCYVKLLKRIRGNYPDAQIFCCLGTMMWGGNYKKNRTHIKSAIEKCADEKVNFVDLGVQNKAKNGLGGDWHPSLKTHAEMSQKLITAISEVTGWQ